LPEGRLRGVLPHGTAFHGFPEFDSGLEQATTRFSRCLLH
jgi:hypothetical protein